MLVCLKIRRQPGSKSTDRLFPYTTLLRSVRLHRERDKAPANFRKTFQVRFECQQNSAIPTVQGHGFRTGRKPKPFGHGKAYHRRHCKGWAAPSRQFPIVHQAKLRSSPDVETKRSEEHTRELQSLMRI